MSFVMPTTTTIKARFPAFASVDDDLIDLMIPEAARWVDASWVEADRAVAIQLLVAHMLAVEGAKDGGATAISGPLVSRKLGDAERVYASGSRGAVDEMMSANGLAQTAYGRQFLALRQGNFPAVAVV
jgi:hypothetical protein